MSHLHHSDGGRERGGGFFNDTGRKGWRKGRGEDGCEGWVIEKKGKVYERKRKKNLIPPVHYDCCIIHHQLGEGGGWWGGLLHRKTPSQLISNFPHV